MKRSLITILALLTSFEVYSLDAIIKSRLQNFRDPFKKNLIKLSSGGKKNKELKTFFTNREGVESIPIEDIKITGVLLGPERRAIAVELSKGDKAEPFLIKEGMRLGPDGIEVKAILPGGVVLVERIINVYDEEEYLETIIPVSE